ncbi:MAG: DUF5329 domain-containing protein [Luteimonas sp.]
MNRLRSILLVFVFLLVAPLLATAAVTTQSADINALISRVAQTRDVVFIRNGSDHTAAEAAAHLQRKLAAAHGRITTAEQFIDVLATRSSWTGIAYHVRFADGREVESAVWLRQLLREIRTARPMVTTPTPH